MRFEIRERGGQKHLYLVDSTWTSKGPRRTKQVYLGTPDSIWERLLLPSRFKSHLMGKPLALIHAAKETGLLEALQRHLHGDGEMVARLIFLQILGRTDKPLSRAGMERHFARSPVPALLGLAHPPSARQMLRALRRLFGTERVSPEGHPVLSRAVVRRVQGDVLRTLMAKGLDPKFLLFDTTNQHFHHQTAARWMRKGHNKQRRNDKNQLALGMVTAQHIPILSEVLPGNEADPDAFEEVFEALVKRLEALEVATTGLAIVFDRGVNSTDNFDNVLGIMHVIAALDRGQARKLFAHPPEAFAPVVEDAHGMPVLGFSTHWEGFGRIWRVLVTYRRATAAHQRVRWERTRAKVLAKARKWQRGRASTKESTVMNKIMDAIPRDYRSAFRYEVEARGEGKKRRYWPKLEVDPDGEQRLKDSWGKTAIITDMERGQLSDRELVEGFVLRAEIEDQFRWLKDRYVISMAPMWVWNDEAIPGHAFVVLMALALLMYLLWEAKDLHLTMKQMMEALEEVRGAVVIEKGRPPWISLEPLEGIAGTLAARWHWKEMLTP